MQQTFLLAGLRTALFVALDVIGASPAFAQARVADLDEMRRALSPGDLISVVQTTGDSVSTTLSPSKRRAAAEAIEHVE